MHMFSVMFLAHFHSEDYGTLWCHLISRIKPELTTQRFRGAGYDGNKIVVATGATYVRTVHTKRESRIEGNNAWLCKEAEEVF